MKVSLDLISYINKKHGNGDDPLQDGLDALVNKIGAQLGAVDEVIDLGAQYQGIVVAKVISCIDHPNADKLHLCKIDDGGVVKEVPRDEQGYIQVVCGAPNVHEGMLAAWLPPGATVPSSHGSEPFVLDAREIRGQTSQGMLASPKELGLSDNHDGILEIERDDIKPGQAFAEAYDLNDVIIDIENKMFTHRPDCFGHLGVARELAGIRQKAYKSPDWYINPLPIEPEADELPLEVRNEAGNLVPRFMAVAMRDVQVGPSPEWLQSTLTRLGIKSINNVVDSTNIIMLETGQPLHAYDYDKVKAKSGDQAVLVARTAAQLEEIQLLNGKKVAFDDPAVVIATDKAAIGLGGIMGGKDTEVNMSTKNIILECATFDMFNIRRTCMQYGLFTDAATRYTKGQSPLQNDRVLAKIVDEIRTHAGGKVASAVFDAHSGLPKLAEVTVKAGFINERLGTKLIAHEMATLLTNVEFAVTVDSDTLHVTAPFWRTDIEIPEDIVEEVGRLYGFDHLPLVLPAKDLTPARRDPLLTLKSSIRTNLSRAGANEILSYTFVHGDLLDKVGQDRTRAFQLRNAISPDLQYYRLSLTPSLLATVHTNIRSDYIRGEDNEFALFELNKVHQKDRLDDEKLPQEFNNLALVLAADDKTAQRKYSGAPFFMAKKYLMDLLGMYNASGMVKLEPLEGADLYGNTVLEEFVKPFEPKRSAVLRAPDGLVWGVVGEYRAAVKKALKLPDWSAGFEIDFILLGMGQKAKQSSYLPLPKFPKVQQDMTLKVPAQVTYGEVFDFVWSELAKIVPENTMPTLGPLDIYQADRDERYRHISLRFWLASYERTLKAEEVNGFLDKVAAAAKEKFGAERI